MKFRGLTFGISAGRSWRVVVSILSLANFSLVQTLAKTICYSRAIAICCFFFLCFLNSTAAIRTSVNSGDWDDIVLPTWDCACVPADTDTVIISSGHTVTLVGNTVIRGMTVNSNGFLIDDNNDIIVTGNLLLNGTIDARRPFVLSGSGTTIDGSGSITNMGGVTISDGGSGGDKTILSTADLNITNGKFQINTGLTVTNYGTITIFKEIKGISATSTWRNEAGATLNAGGKLLDPLGILFASTVDNIVNYYGKKDQKIKTPDASTYFHLKISGTKIKKMQDNLDINGNLRIESAIFDVIAGSDYTINLAGNWYNAGTFNKRNGLVILDGSGNQTFTSPLGADTLYDLTINKSGGNVTLTNCDISVSDTLTMTAGDVYTGTNVLMLGTNTANVGELTHTSGTIIGKFERWINASGTSVFYPIGTGDTIRPATVIFTNLTSGSLIGEFIESAPGSKDLSLSEDGLTFYNTFVDGYWELTEANGLASTDYDLELTGNGFSGFTVTPVTRIIRSISPFTVWDHDGASFAGTHVAAVDPTAKRDALSGFSAHFAFADTTACSAPITSSIFGPDSVCINIGASYSVTNPTSDYEWTVTGGTVSFGQGTNVVTVNWGSTGMIGNVRVVETNGCTRGAPVDLAVSIHTLPPSSISGLTAVAENTDSVFYTITPLPGYTYAWAVIGGGSIIWTGAGTDSILVNWGAAGTGNVSVVASSACPSAPAVDIDVTIYLNIESITTGDWDAIIATKGYDTWNCECVPSATSNVSIMNTHTVTLVANTRVKNFIINAGGTLFDDGNNMDVDGSILVNGDYTGTKDLKLNGIGSTIDGTGTISTVGKLKLKMGAKTILSSAILKRTSGITVVEESITVTNNGNITFDFNLNNGGMGAPIWINEANSTLSVGANLLPTGNLFASATGNTVNYNGSGAQTVKCSNAGQYYHFKLSNNGTKSLVCNINVGGNLTISDTVQLDVVSYTITLAGNWSNSSTNADPFLEQSQTVTFDGTGSQSITNTSGETFYGLIMSKSTGTMNLNDNVTVSNTLTMTQGDINTGSDTLMLGTSPANVGALSRTAGSVIGRFERWINATSPTTWLFPLGTSSYYRPALITFTDLTNGSLVGEFVATDPGNNGLTLYEAPDSIYRAFTEGYWVLTARNSLASANYALELTGDEFISYPLIPATRVLKRTNPAAVWTLLDGAHDAAVGNTAKRNTLVGGFGQFGFGSTTDPRIGFTGPGGVGDALSNDLWLTADALSLNDNDPVSTWADTSGNNNDATQVGGSRPTYKTNILNGKPVLRFNGTDDYFANVFAVTSQNMTIYTVFSHDHNGTSAPTGPLWQTEDVGNSGFFPKYLNGNQYLWTGVWLTKTSTFVRNDWYSSIALHGSSKSELWQNGTLNHANSTNTLGLGNFQIGYRNSNSQFFKGDIAELVFYRTNLNIARRIIVENYLAAKYNLGIANDKYAYQATHGNEVAGIGRENSANLHSKAQSAGIVTFSQANSLGDGDYLLFGHDTGSVSGWITTEVPNSDTINVKRLAREWRLSETGEVGTVTITLDTSLLPARPTAFCYYVLWIDADGDFSSGSTQYILSSASAGASLYEARGVDIANGDYIAFGIIRPQIDFALSSSNGFEDISPVTIEISLNYALETDVTVDYSVTGGTATGGGVDYTLLGSTATISSGSTTTNITLNITDDILVESDETALISLSNPSACVLIGSDTTHTYTINDIDNLRKIDFSVSGSSNAENITPVILTIQINLVDAVNPTTVDYKVTGGTATGGGVDYSLASGTATIDPGDTDTTISITINDDACDENNETIVVTLLNPTNANLGTNIIYTYTIVDNDIPPTVQFFSTSSGAIESSSLPILIELSKVTCQDVTVDYAITGGSATGGVDFTLIAGTATIIAGSTTISINPGVVDDIIIEIDETIIITLSNPSNATLGAQPVHTYTISDNDAIGHVGAGGVGESINNPLWLCADALGLNNNDPVSTWSDKSGNGNDATQGTVPNQPIFKDNIVNNKPVIGFDGNDFFANVFNITNQNMTIFTVFAHDHNGTSDPTGPIWQTENVSASGFFPRYKNNRQYLWTGAGTPGNWLNKPSEFSQSTWYTSLVRHGADTTELWKDGVLNHALGNNAVGTGSFRIGYRSSGSQYFKGDVAEIIFYSFALNTAQRIIVDNYLSAKYSIAIANDKYPYDAAYGNEVAGIGRDDIDNLHIDAQGSSIVRINNASSLDNGDYLLWGHNDSIGTCNGDTCAYDSIDVPTGVHNRMTKVWRIKETGEVGTVTISFDLSGYLAIDNDTDLVLLIDDNGTFSTGTDIYETGRTWDAVNKIVTFTGVDFTTGKVAKDFFTLASKAVKTPLNPLPIELLYFAAEINGAQVDLEWATVSESNNDYFTVERSTDGSDFEFVTYVKGAGTSNTKQFYKTVDPDPYFGLSYYRLKQTDFDGAESYYGPVSVFYVNEMDEEISIAVYPNPTYGQFFVEVKGKENAEVLVVVLDILGKQHYSKVIILDNNGYTLAMDPSKKLSAGVYLIIASSNNKLYNKKLVVR